MNEQIETALTRRLFFLALCASALAAGVPLPIRSAPHVFDAADVVWTAVRGPVEMMVGTWEGILWIERERLFVRPQRPKCDTEC